MKSKPTLLDQVLTPVYAVKNLLRKELYRYNLIKDTKKLMKTFKATVRCKK